MDIMAGWDGEETKPIQSQSKPNAGLWSELEATNGQIANSKSGFSPAGSFEKTKPIFERVK
jgi:hypothetical protein